MNSHEMEKEKMSSASSSSSLKKNIFALLPEDVILEILHRLPLKSVFKFKSVSRYFSSLISSPSFCHHYTTSRSNLSPGLFFEFTIYFTNKCSLEFLYPNIIYHDAAIDLKYPANLPDEIIFNSHIGEEEEEEAKATKDCTGFSLSFLPHHRADYYPTAVIASNNGLLLGKNLIVGYYIFNPLAKQWVALPMLPTEYKEEMLLGFVCDTPTSSSDGCTIDEYKVVRVLHPRKQQDWSFIELETFSATAGLWKQSRVALPKRLPYRATERCSNAARVSCDGVLYWVCYEHQLLLIYSTRVEQCWVVDLPGWNYPSPGWNNIRPDRPLLQLSGGRIWFVYFTYPSNNINLNMWILRRNGDDFTWSFERRIDLKELATVGDSAKTTPSLFEFRPNYLSSFNETALHPLDPNILFLKSCLCLVRCNLRKSCLCLVRCNLRRKTAQVLQLSIDGRFLTEIVTSHLPWPTRIPRPSWPCQFLAATDDDDARRDHPRCGKSAPLI